MNREMDDALGLGLRELTRPAAQEPMLISAALQAESKGRRLAWRWAREGAAAAVVVLAVGLAIVFSPRGGSLSAPRPVQSELAGASAVARVSAKGSMPSAHAPAESAIGMRVTPTPETNGAMMAGAPFVASNSAALESAPVDRRVSRIASIEVRVRDVAAAFAAASRFPEGDAGEFVQQASLTGEGAAAKGTLTLRVASERLESALARIRALGAVASESASAEDITAQVVDVAARIRNEERVEAELLDLLEKRAGAPLKDVLELRARLAEVRQAIERLRGQEQRLDRLSTLATVNVVITRQQETQKGAAPGAGVFSTLWPALVNGARDGVAMLAGSVRWIVETAIGGAPWWIALAAAVIGGRRLLRARTAAAISRPIGGAW